jgi:CheY-like chemotaxis protein
MTENKMQTKIKVLVVEDHKIAQKVAFIVLNNLNCEVDIASDAKEALEFFEQKKYDLVLMDIGLPDMDGLAVTTAMRLKEEVDQTPIVGLTAHAGEHIRSRAIEVGMNDLLVKPLLKENCMLILNNFVSK